MGVFIVDHRLGGELDGSRGKLHEWETVSCLHCQAVIRIFIKGCRKKLETKYSCSTCMGPICRDCAKAMNETKWCPGEFLAQIDRLISAKR